MDFTSFTEQNLSYLKNWFIWLLTFNFSTFQPQLRSLQPVFMEDIRNLYDWLKISRWWSYYHQAYT